MYIDRILFPRLLRRAYVVYGNDRYRKLIPSRSENQREALFYPLK